MRSGVRVIVAGALVAVLAGCTELMPPAADAPTSVVPPTEQPTPPPAASADPAFTDALTLLNTITVKGRAPKTGYDREGMFGSAWVDVDRNGCDTRNDILARDLINLTFDGSTCTVLTGTLNDPFTGTVIGFTRGQATSSDVQIDHVVALLNAWESGAAQLTQQQRVAFANDPINLLAVDGPSNSSKGAGDAATWLPSNKAFRCDYVTAQTQVKAKYGLSMTQTESDTIRTILSNCGNVPLEPIVPVEPPTGGEPAVEAPVSDSPATIHPGGFCDELGATGTSSNGKTYTCGKNGADAGGRHHWNS
jgi:hypothetical protein